ncbi:MAG TPA: SDR family oxidoreductase [Streptosporangiaceae bacterium]|nr:SDR family oxidoreductase [Streptosporangiaceae bacterium]
MTGPPAGPLLAGKVVLVTGVGPDLGRAIAVRSAEAGADLVLAARTASRLDDVAKEVTALGRRAVPVPADVTGEAAAARLAEAALAAFGRVDTVVHNAFAIPPLAPLAETGLDAIRAAFETNALAALRLTRLLTPALASSRGSVVMINSAVLRHSRVTFGGYKMAKSALLALAQSLATELGPQGVRVNSVAPGWIWGSTLQSYFGHLAKQRGVDRQQVYDETAATTDLRRLPEPAQVADAVVFLASPMAAAITGQCLDVNCGEFHQ